MLAYYIVSHAGNGLCLSVEATGTITGRTNVSLSPMTIGNMNQLWLLSSSSMTGIEVSTANNPAYMLNARKSTWNCDVYTSNADTVLNFLYTSDNCYKIQLSSDPTRYLTAAAALTAAVVPSGSNVDWKTASPANANAQLWKLVQTSIPDPPAEKILTMPAGRNCNWNQKCKAVVDLFGEKACKLVCGLDVANFYATNSVGYTPASMDSTTYWTEDGYTWRVPGPGAFSNPTSGLTDEEYFSAIRTQIISNHPVIISIRKSEGGTTHTVFAYGYTGSGTSASQILVFDPANGKPADNPPETGAKRTLYAAMEYNSGKFIIAGIRFTYSA